MDWDTYSKMLDEKVADAKSNYDKAEKDYLQAKAKYETIVDERERFLDFRIRQIQ
jgi:hypothetical protein